MQGLRELAAHAGGAPGSDPAVLASAIDFVLEGLYAQKKISRNDERGYSAAETAAAPADAARGAGDQRRSPDPDGEEEILQLGTGARGWGLGLELGSQD